MKSTNRPVCLHCQQTGQGQQVQPTAAAKPGLGEVLHGLGSLLTLIGCGLPLLFCLGSWLLSPFIPKPDWYSAAGHLKVGARVYYGETASGSKEPYGVVQDFEFNRQKVDVNADGSYTVDKYHVVKIRFPSGNEGWIRRDMLNSGKFWISSKDPALKR